MDQFPTVQKSSNLYSIHSMRFSANSPDKKYIYFSIPWIREIPFPFSQTFHSILSATVEQVDNIVVLGYILSKMGSLDHP